MFLNPDSLQGGANFLGGFGTAAVSEVRLASVLGNSGFGSGAAVLDTNVTLSAPAEIVLDFLAYPKSEISSTPGGPPPDAVHVVVSNFVQILFWPGSALIPGVNEGFTWFPGNLILEGTEDLAPFSLGGAASLDSSPGGFVFDPGTFGEFRAHTPILPAGIYTLDLRVSTRAFESTVPWPPTAYLLVGTILVAVMKARRVLARGIHGANDAV